MRVGLFVEGRGDAAVITNILKGALDIDRTDIKHEVPEFDYDETDLHTMNPDQHSNWTIVKQTCIDKIKIAKFLDTPFDDGRFVVIHIDTAERHLAGYDVPAPEKKGLTSIDYCSQVRSNVISKIDEWLDKSFSGKIAYAVAIEETDAWVLTIYEETADTSKYENPKKRLNDDLNKMLSKKEKSIFNLKTFDKYHWLSQDFRKPKKLKACMAKNESLKLFCISLQKFKTDDVD